MERQPTVKKLAYLTEQAANVLRSNPAEIARIKYDMQDFDIPAQGCINAGFQRMGVARFTRSGDDLWEMIGAIENGWTYRRPARYLLDRWAAA